MAVDTADPALEEEVDDDEQPKKRGPVPIEDLGELGWSDAEGALNLHALVTYSGQRTGTTDVAPEFKFRTPLDGGTLVELGEMLGQLPLSISFAGYKVGSGGELKNFRAAAEADGDRFIEALIRFPSNQLKTAVQAGIYVRKAGILAIVPDQLSFDLTKRAE